MAGVHLHQCGYASHGYGADRRVLTQQAPLSRSISNGSDEYGRPKKSGGREPPSGTLEGSISALADALNSLEAVTCSDPAKKLDFEPFHQVCIPVCTNFTA